jgi:hypothetical protein
MPQFIGSVAMFVSHPFVATPSQSAKPALQANPHDVPSHVEEALAGGAGQGTHVMPHVEVDVLLAHVPLHRWKPMLQTTPQLVPSHVAVALGGEGGQGVHDIPHDAVEELLAQAVPQKWKPLLQATPHWPLEEHVAMPFAVPGHGVQEEPHVAGSELLTQLLPQKWKPPPHASPHWPLDEQVAMPFAVPGHGVQEEPHVAGSELLTHVLPHAWKPGLHANWQRPPEHDTTAFDTGMHATLQSPQWLGLVWRSTQVFPHRVGACDVQPVEQPNCPEPLTGAQTGAAMGHTALHAPQCDGSERSVSHPFDALPSQSA